MQWILCIILKRLRKCCVNWFGTISKIYREVKKGWSRAMCRVYVTLFQSKSVCAQAGWSESWNRGCLLEGNWVTGSGGGRETCFSEHFLPFKFCTKCLYIYLQDKKGKGNAPPVILMSTKIKNHWERGTAETTQERVNCSLKYKRPFSRGWRHLSTVGMGRPGVARARNGN